ncbi:cyanophycinase [Sediminitomix flava]|uniref:Cyanophycinase n=1 Tax=Sediminitomix flava TaxID=379075 RepID=A0A315ZBX2_SEDFL|nr:cyanophycinase [Sediminitomix flava]PWJ42288.1 cyanophycinase [Sediminitomix flava]
MKLRKFLYIISLLSISIVGCEKQSEEEQSSSERRGGSPKMYLTGSSSDVQTNSKFGIALMGGADANTIAEQRAFEFLVDQSNGGDVVVLRSSGTDGYNSFIYNDIGGVNSVRTFVITKRSQASHSSLITAVNNAEIIFMTGGNQDDYVSYWKDTDLETAINNAVNFNGASIGGTSAGLAILGELYYSAANGTVYSDEALDDPYDTYMAGLGDRFLDVDYMDNVITDTHYNERDRQGRHFTFMARMVKDFGVSASNIKGIGVDEATSVTVDHNGYAKVYGSGDAYFLRGQGKTPETCKSGTRLTWNDGGQAVKANVLRGTNSGSNEFDMVNWSTNDGSVEYWSANNGNFVRN